MAMPFNLPVYSVLILVLLHSSFGQPLDANGIIEKYDNCMWMQGPPANYRLWWTITGNTIQFAMEANTTGWVALGLNHVGSMDGGGKGTDIYLGYMWKSENKTLVPHVGDYWTTQRAMPQKDAVQDISSIHGMQTEQGLTVVEFSRPLATGDSAQDLPIMPSHNMYVLWAISKSKPVDEEGTRFAKHTWRGSRAVRFATKSQCSEHPPADNAGANKWSNSDDSYSLTWEVDQLARTAKFTVTARTKGWVGFGLSESASMPNSDAVVGWVDDKTGQGHLFDMWIGPHREQPKTDVALGGTADVTLLASSQTTDSDTKEPITSLTFQRKFSTGDKFDMDLADKHYYVLWALGAEDGDPTAVTFQMHTNKGVFQANFMTQVVQSVVDTDSTIAHSTFRTAHGSLMMVAWTLFIAPGMFVARYIKPHSPAWWHAHLFLQILGLVAYIAAFGIVVWEIGVFTTEEHFKGWHGKIGLSVIIISILQSVLGIFARCKYNPDRVVSPIWPDQIHWWIGRVLFVGALANIFFGLQHYGLLPYPARLEKMEPWTAFTCVGIALTLSIWFVVGIVFSIVTECKYSPRAIKRKRTENYGIEVEDLLSPSQQATPLTADYDENDNEEEVDIDSDDEDEAMAKNRRVPNNISPTKPFICFLIVHVVLITVAIALLAAIPNDQPKAAYQLCPDCETRTIQFDKFRVPIGYHSDPGVNNQTTYVCQKFDLGAETTDYIVEMEAILDNVQVLHHLVVFAVAEDYANAALGQYFPCLMPNDATPLFIWAPGMPTLRLPADVGFRAGKTPEGMEPSYRFLMLQIHYDNPSLDPNQVDSSGVKISLTPHPMAHEAGLLSVLVNQTTIRIPPRVNETEIWANCAADQTERFKHSIHVFAINPHAHKFARFVWTEHWRNGERLGVVNPLGHFDFNDQKLFTVNVEVAQGDELITHCLYDTSNSAVEIIGGDTTENEMCLTNLLYWPKIDKIVGCGGDANYTPSSWRPEDYRRALRH